jgi:hypothetical protein
METLSTLFQILFVGIWLFAMIEVIATWLFVPFFFRLGPKVKTVQKVDINLGRFKIGKEYTTAHAKFIRISKDTCLFRHRDSFFHSHTPFPVKAEISQSEIGSFLIWRVPLSTSIFFGLVLISLLTGGILSLLRMETAADFSAIGWTIGFTLVLVMLSAGVEGKRARTAFSEIKTLSETFEKPIDPTVLFYKLNLSEKSGENMSRETARTQLQSGEHIIKTFIGQKRASAPTHPSPFPAGWYCVTLTQAMLVLIELDPDQKPVSVRRIPFSQVLSADFEKGWLNPDRVSLDFGTNYFLDLNVNHALRNQAQALCSVFSQT